MGDFHQNTPVTVKTIQKKQFVPFLSKVNLICSPAYPHKCLEAATLENQYFSKCRKFHFYVDVFTVTTMMVMGMSLPLPISFKEIFNLVEIKLVV